MAISRENEAGLQYQVTCSLELNEYYRIWGQLFQILLTRSCASNILVYFPIKSKKITTSNKMNTDILGVPNLVP